VKSTVDEQGNAAYAMVTRGWMPYTLHWRLRLQPDASPRHMLLEGIDDLDGRCECSLEQEGDGVAITFDWRLSPRRPLLRFVATALHPLFVANYRWVMACGEESLRLEMRRLLAATDAERAAVPAPPRPISMRASWKMVLIVGLSLVVPGSILLRHAAQRAGDSQTGVRR
jgi:hypothetical protein